MIITPSITSAILNPSPDNPISYTRHKSSKEDEKSAKKQMADYELPPRNYGLSNHYYHYGWPVTDQMLEEILIKLQIPLPPPVPDVLPATLGSYLMRWLHFRNGFSYVWCKPDEWCEIQNRVWVHRKEGREETPYVTFLTIGCTYSKKYFYRRPTQEAFETLIEVFGERPRWLEGLDTKQEFTLDIMNC